MKKYKDHYKGVFESIKNHYGIVKKNRLPRKEKKRLKKLFAGNIGAKAWRKHRQEHAKFYINMAPFWQKQWEEFIGIRHSLEGATYDTFWPENKVEDVDFD